MSAVSGTIMLVEDDPADVRLIQLAFTKAGLDAGVVRLANGDDAVREPGCLSLAFAVDPGQ